MSERTAAHLYAAGCHYDCPPAQTLQGLERLAPAVRKQLEYDPAQTESFTSQTMCTSRHGTQIHAHGSTKLLCNNTTSINQQKQIFNLLLALGAGAGTAAAAGTDVDPGFAGACAEARALETHFTGTKDTKQHRAVSCDCVKNSQAICLKHPAWEATAAAVAVSAASQDVRTPCSGALS